MLPSDADMKLQYKGGRLRREPRKEENMAYLGFDKLKGQLAGKKGVTDPGALAASIGKKKYGAKKFQKAAAKGQSLKGQAAAFGKG